ncbi:MAG: DUF4258 domain-containing protein [Desulfurococcales archaeon]|nr:DUF4258 domain-containing protein [Desulfurococcales archaeon]
MKIHYTFHAIERMRQRDINREEIETCLNNPDKTIEDKEFKCINKCIKRLNDKALVVVYRMETDTIIVITAYRTSKLYKYL